MTFDNVSRVMTVKKTVEKLYCKFRVFVYLLSLLHFLFSYFRSLRRGYLSSLVVNGRGKRRSAYIYPYQNTKMLMTLKQRQNTVADPGLQIREVGRRGGGGITRPWDNGVAWPQKNFFRPFRPHFGLKIKGGPGPRGPSPGSATEIQFRA